MEISGGGDSLLSPGSAETRSKCLNCSILWFCFCGSVMFFAVSRRHKLLSIGASLYCCVFSFPCPSIGQPTEAFTRQWLLLKFEYYGLLCLVTANLNKIPCTKCFILESEGDPLLFVWHYETQYAFNPKLCTIDCGWADIILKIHSPISISCNEWLVYPHVSLV